MPVDALPATVCRFVEGHFDTVTAVEVLLLLHRERPRAWSSGAVARELRIDHDQTCAILDGFSRSGLVRRRGFTFEYEPRTEEVAGAVDMLSGLYSRYRHRISYLIFTNRPRPDAS
jgi:hypothetical protein